MPSCCVPLCTSGYTSDRNARKKDGRAMPSFFRIKPEQVETWNRAIPRQDRVLTCNDWVCSEHFHETDVIRFFPDVTIGDKIIKGEPRVKPVLRQDAVPSIFGGPSYLNKSKRCRRNNRTKSIEDSSSNIVAQTIQQDVLVKIKLPGRSWCTHVSQDHDIFMKLSEDGTVTHRVHIEKKTRNLKVTIRGCTYPPYSDMKAANNKELNEVLHQVDLLKICGGTGCGSFSLKCVGGISTGIMCKFCRGHKKMMAKKKKREMKDTRRKQLTKARKHRVYKLRKQKENYQKQAKSMKKELRNLYKICQRLEKSTLEERIKTLPKVQQDAVHACLDAAKRQGPHGNRYEAEWVYECLLMRIKSPALYEHIRDNNILPLPSRTTLNRYMRKLPPVFGFQSVLFSVLKQKLASMPEAQRHGNIIIDEMKVPTGVSFDRHTLKVIGLVDLGDFTPESEQGKMGDHILEVLFQPFQGKWVQSLGVFLSRGNCKGETLAKILIEAIALSENAGLFVDGISTDAASWNRNMWKSFGIDEKHNSCEHPKRENCKLHFFSDWSHIIKCARNIMSPELPNKPKEDAPKVKRRKTKLGPDGAVLSEEEIYKQKTQAALNKEIEVPEGVVRRQHWIRVLEEEEKLRAKQGIAALSYVPKLTRTHIFPDGFERMNVKMAYKFFGNNMAAGMEYYRLRGVKGLEDSEVTSNFIKKFNSLADAMNSNSAAGAIRKGNDKEEIIRDYLEYHKRCVENARKKGLKAFLSEETDLGMSVTLQSTLELSSYLINEVGFKFVMTARFNSDAIEQFFGKLRNALRQNPHPDPKIFIQMHRLLTIYSLVKPPKGCNVAGGENLKNLLTAEDALKESENERLNEISDMLDEITMNGEVLDALPGSAALDHSYLAKPVECEENLSSFMAGFTAFRQEKVARGCHDCLMTFTVFREETGSDCTFTKIKEMYNGYSYPSPELKSVVKTCERAIRESLSNGLCRDIFRKILQYIRLDTLSLVGCIEHKEEVTKKIISFYLIMRMFFATDRQNEDTRMKKKQGKKLVKKSKLV